MNFRNFEFEEDSFSKNAQGISKIYHEVLLLMKFFSTKPQIKNMNIKFYGFYYTFYKNGDDKEIVNNESENDYIFLMTS